ncbi:MAG: hypothetical protein IBJ12_06840 [Sphingomonadaceae bacterium]|nr:hypothetical protein [Sphingomonadaceae bacterium]
MIEDLQDRHRAVSLKLLVALWLFVSAALIWSGWAEITTLSGWDPDDALRLVQLRDFLGGQSWFDTTQYRMNLPEGAPMHWSRLIELPLALLIIALRPLFGQPVAEMVAGTAVPLMLLGWIAYMLSRIATHISSREAGVAAALITLSSGALLIQTRPMRIDHHGWQLAMAVLALSTMFRAEARRAGLVLGLALAIWLHISLEGAPMTAAFFLLLGLRWVRDADEGARLLWTIVGFALASLILFFGTQAQGLFATTYCDTVSPPHVYAILLAAIVMGPAIRFLPDDWRLRLAAAAIAGTGALGAIYMLAPQCVGGAFGNMDPLVREYWYSKVNEGLPAWHQSWRTMVNLGAGLFCGAVSWFVLRAKLKTEDRRKLGTIGFFLFYGLLLSILIIRTISVATAFAIPVAAALVALLFERYRKSRVPLLRILLVAVMLAILVPGAVVSSLIQATASGENTRQKQATSSNELCQSALSVRALSRLPKGNIVAPFDIGPMILAQTQHSVLASSHHRNERAMHDHIEIFRSKPEASRRLLKARNINYLVACPKEAELDFYATQDPNGLWAQISKTKVPAWLEPLPDLGEGIKVWRVR